MMTKTPKPRGRPRKPVQLFTHDGQTHTFAEWEEIRGLTAGTIRTRLNAGESLADAVLRLPQRNAPAAIEVDDNRPASSPQQPGGWKPDLVRHQGQWVSIKEWRTRTGLTSDQLSERVHVLGWDFHRALHQPKE
jgi:hypothetical protein